MGTIKFLPFIFTIYLSVNFFCSKKEIFTIVKLNESVHDVFGLPIEIEFLESISFCIKDNKVVRDSLNGEGILEFVKQGELVSFNFIGKDKSEIIGQFLIPRYERIDFRKTYDPFTYKVTKLDPFSYYEFLRIGVWNYLDSNGERYEHTYSLELNKLVKGAVLCK